MTGWLAQPLVRGGSRLFVIAWNRSCSSAKPKRPDTLSSLFIKAKEDGFSPQARHLPIHRAASILAHL